MGKTVESASCIGAAAPQAGGEIYDMKDEAFAKLVESVKQAGEIKRGVRENRSGL